MAAKKTVKTRKIRSIVPIVWAVLGLGFVVLVFAIFSYISMLKDLADDSFVRSMAQQAIEYKQRLVVDAQHKTAYVPEMNLVMPYNDMLTTSMRYTLSRDDESQQKGEVIFSTLGELYKVGNNKQTHHPESNGCWAAFFLTVGADLTTGEQAKEVSRYTLQDGREVVVYKSTDQACTSLVDSADGGTIIDMLEHVKSY